MSITFKLDGVQKALNALAKTESAVIDEVDMELADGANAIRATAVTNVKRNINSTTGQLANKMYAEPVGRLMHEVGNNAYHAPYIEFGTGGKVKVPEQLREIALQIQGRKPDENRNFAAMVGSIYEWGVRKGYIDKKDKKGRQKARWWAIRILKNGIDPQPFLYPAFVTSRKTIVDRIKRVIEKPR